MSDQRQNALAALASQIRLLAEEVATLKHPMLDSLFAEAERELTRVLEHERQGDTAPADGREARSPEPRRQPRPD